MAGQSRPDPTTWRYFLSLWSVRHPHGRRAVAGVVNRFVSRPHIQGQGGWQSAIFAARRWLCRGLATVGATLLATTVDRDRPAIRRCECRFGEVSGSVAMHSIRASELDGGRDFLYDYWELQWEPGAQVGAPYYPALQGGDWGAWAEPHRAFTRPIACPRRHYPAAFAPASIERRVCAFSFAPAITWQFFENSFVHL